MNRIIKKYSTALVLFALSTYNLTGCGQFQEVFNKDAKSSHQISKKKKAKKIKAKKGSGEDVFAKDHRDPISTKKGVYYFVQSGDTLSQIARRYNIKTKEIAQINGLYDQSSLIIGRRVFIPRKKFKKDYLSVSNILYDFNFKVDDSKQKVAFKWPVKVFRLSSKFGWRRGRPHDGIDLAAKTGTPIYSAAEGKVIYSKRFSGYGNLLVVKHAGSYFTAYAHAHKLKVKVGDVVKQGQQIATVGTTGKSTGPHLHFEVHKKEVAVDPMTVLPKRK